MNKILLVISALIFSFTSFAQQVIESDQQLNLYNSQLRIIHSSIVNDDYYIYISLPDDYGSSDKSYPVLYLLDGDISFGMGASIARYLQVGDNIPELIVVGIGYGALKSSNGNVRRRDFTFSEVPNRSDFGGAPKFISFIRDELFPFINSTYRTNPDDRTINSYSLGGLLASYILFTEPELFNRYIIGSPHLGSDNYKIFDVQENAFNSFVDINAKVFISVGSEESDDEYFNPIDQLVSGINDKAYPSLKMETKVFDGGTHLLCPPEVLSYGLISVFSK
jgi:predicted alpha/beta superfamily hydrolase